jgi:thiol-disulfide isomerase/thioredoxin
MTAMRPIALALAAALGASVLGCGPGLPPPSAPHALLAKPGPELKRRSIDGASIDTAKLRGRAVVVKFFAKYCEPCKRTLPLAASFAKSHPEVAVIGVAEDESEADVRAVVSEYRLEFPVVHDQGNVVAGRFRVKDLPAVFVIDGQGVLRWVGTSNEPEDGFVAAALTYK